MSDRAATRKLLLFVLHPAGLRFRGGVVRVRTIEPHAFSPPALIELRADDVPALAQVQDAMLNPAVQALGRDATSTPIPPLPSTGVSFASEAGIHGKPTKPTAKDVPRAKTRAANTVRHE